ncbi:hypothetical protein GCM10008090_26690 [Arenicella chitinivorans]|uniref:Uncharacterized protein n=1 Tax=Arenicella chitinivorans TaxID=1329800 RepID=A0A918VR70_9GAMM|nr:hypothetical protein [Arenicella chitinivorans]GHA15762.1 hypothetical protein GCM10008090_26690 [Arenicella chitinivorans]
MFLSQYTPHLLTAGSLFVAIYLHARQSRLSFWQLSLWSAVGSAVLAITVIFFIHDNYLNLPVEVSALERLYAILMVCVLSFVYGLILALLVGYVMKLAPSFFD